MPPPGWQPPPGWEPDPVWPPAPEGWQFWVWEPDGPAVPPPEPPRVKRPQPMHVFGGSYEGEPPPGAPTGSQNFIVDEHGVGLGLVRVKHDLLGWDQVAGIWVAGPATKVRGESSLVGVRLRSGDVVRFRIKATSASSVLSGLGPWMSLFQVSLLEPPPAEAGGLGADRVEGMPGRSDDPGPGSPGQEQVEPVVTAAAAPSDAGVLAQDHVIRGEVGEEPAVPGPDTGQTPPEVTEPGDPGSQVVAADGRVRTSPGAGEAHPGQKTSWWATRKHARELKKALAEWQDEQDDLDLAVNFARALASHGVPASIMLKPGEVAVWSGPAGLVEPQRRPGQYVGGSRGLSIPIYAGVRVRVGATRGTYIPGEQTPTVTDSGTAVVTSTRVVFTGEMKTREWSYAKVISHNSTGDGLTTLIHVSNRQTASGLRTRSRELLIALTVSLMAVEDTPARILAVVTGEADQHRAERPSA